MKTADHTTLIGYTHSIYTRIARMALHAKDAAFTEVEVIPFAPPLPAGYPHPFDRVPVLTHGTFTLYETAAITRYIDLAFPGPSLVPPGAKAASRMAQVISIAGAYAFRPPVLQVYAHRVFRAVEGLPSDETQISCLTAAARVLAALETIAGKGTVLTGTRITLADCHLAPMIAAFDAADEGRTALERYPALGTWWRQVQHQSCLALYGRDLPTRKVAD
jgi:glutathione S-transferase